MTIEEAKNGIEILRSEGRSDEEILNIVYEMYQNNEISIDELKMLSQLLGYEFEEELEEDSEEVETTNEAEEELEEVEKTETEELVDEIIEEASEEVAEEKEMTLEESLIFELQKLDIQLEEYEYIMPEDMTEEALNEMNELKGKIKELKAQLKVVKKEKKPTTIWGKLNLPFIIYAAVAFIITVYPLGPIISGHYFSLVLKFANLFADYITSDTLLTIILFVLYLCYYLIFIGGDFLFYRYIKKNKINLYTLITIVSIHTLTTFISVILVRDAFF